ncbi:cyclin-like protein [Pelagophyceae sp. CCMP2097]|nr:cyclin-like protein [Pelagophyceae sp. CCMP2097]
MASRRAFQDITNSLAESGSVATLPGTKKTLKSERKADDVDARDASNPQAVTEYVNDMYAHFREKEVEVSVSPTYMTRQAHINEKMRAILIDWLVEVHLKFKLVPETLYLTVNLIDRYLLNSPVERSNLQLVGVSALLLASKYEEIYPPELKDLVYITDKAYTQEQILGMEEKMVKSLKYKMTIASIHCFMMRYLKAGHADRRMVWLASYVSERMLQEYAMLKYLPSMIAACAVFIARKNLGRNAWSPTLIHYAQYTEPGLRACLLEMGAILTNAKGSLHAVKKKYSSEKYGQVALMQLEILE